MTKKSSNKRLYLILGAIVIVILGGLGLAKALGWIGKPKATQVMLGKASLNTIIEKVSASGKIQPLDEVKISSEVSGEVIELLIKEGDSVKKGTLMARIRPDNLRSSLEMQTANMNNQRANLLRSQANLAQAQAQAQRAEQDFNRQKKLRDDKVISEQDLEISKANYEGAKANLEAAKQTIEAAKFTVASAAAQVKDAQVRLSLTQIFAPMDGIVTKLNIEKGERVVGTQQMAGTEMCRVANLNQMEVKVNVNENDIVRINIGDTAIVDVDAYSANGKKFKGVVYSIANSANNIASADLVTEFEVRILMLNESFAELTKEKHAPPFRPGMTASVDIITERKENVLSVPLSSVSTRKKKEIEAQLKKEKTDNQDIKTKNIGDNQPQEIVFVYDSLNKKAIIVPVKTGISDFDNIQILEGITQGQQVITAPFKEVSEKLKHDQAVEPMEDEKKK